MKSYKTVKIEFSINVKNQFQYLLIEKKNNWQILRGTLRNRAKSLLVRYAKTLSQKLCKTAENAQKPFDLFHRFFPPPFEENLEKNSFTSILATWCLLKVPPKINFSAFIGLPESPQASKMLESESSLWICVVSRSFSSLSWLSLVVCWFLKLEVRVLRLNLLTVHFWSVSFETWKDEFSLILVVLDKI